MAGIKKGDVVTVLSGRDRGKSGKVLEVFRERDAALVERLNVLKHFERRSQQNPNGGVVAREGAIPMAKLALTCQKCRRTVRIGWTIAADGTKQRVCRRCKGGI
jgi:large subunit ribosomal protein L24